MPCMGLDLAVFSGARPTGRSPWSPRPPPRWVRPTTAPTVSPHCSGRSPAGCATTASPRTVWLVDDRIACVAMTLPSVDDLGIHYVATEAAYRRRGLATRLLTVVLQRGRDDGMRTATLQASPDGLPVYRRMDFREVGLLRAFVRPPAGTDA